MPTRITVNGKEYRSVKEMPPDARAAYERAMSMLADRDGNGVPDIVDGGNRISTQSFDDAGRSVVTTEVTSSRYIINGHEYQRVDDIPANLRKMIQEAGTSLHSPAGSSQVEVLSNSGGSTRMRSRTADVGAGGFTIRLTWSTLFAVLAALVVTAVVAWVVTG